MLHISEKNKFVGKTAELVMFVGIPASGKSSLANEYREKGYKILSSDEIRLSLLKLGADHPYKQEEINALNRQVFEEIKRETSASLARGVSVVLDATNLNRKRRMSALADLGNVPCVKKCVLFITPREVCFERNSKRSGIALVPDAVMKRMLRSFECPAYCEGWDEIIPVICGSEYAFPFEETADFAQDNPHHTLTLGEHLEATRRFAEKNGYPPHLKRIALYHDIGKLYTKEFTNWKGERTDFAHFYGHENYGAYLYLTQMCCGKELTKEQFGDVLYETCLINCHMRPLTAWAESVSAKENDTLLFGEKFIADLVALNRADKAAH